jgi:cell wall-associated NlpC family hydrolase
LYSSFIAEKLEFHPKKSDIVEAARELVGSTSQLYIRDHPEIGQSPPAFDCSGFARFVLTRAGFHIPDYIGMDDVQRPIRHANEFWDHYGANVQTEPEGGDLIFFSRNGLYPHHVGIVQDGGSYIHAPGRDGTQVSVEDIVPENIIPRAGSDRVLYPTNPIGFKAPTIPLNSSTYRYHQKLAE